MKKILIFLFLIGILISGCSNQTNLPEKNNYSNENMANKVFNLSEKTKNEKPIINISYHNPFNYSYIITKYPEAKKIDKSLPKNMFESRDICYSFYSDMEKIRTFMILDAENLEQNYYYPWVKYNNSELCNNLFSQLQKKRVEFNSTMIQEYYYAKKINCDWPFNHCSNLSCGNCQSNCDNITTAEEKNAEVEYSKYNNRQVSDEYINIATQLNLNCIEN